MSKSRSRGQQIGALGERLVAMVSEKSGCWLPRHQGEDFGIDLELELTKPAVMGEILKVQVKSNATIGRRAGEIECSLPRSLVRLGENLRVPLILIVAETNTDRAWYLWVQRWWQELRRKGARFDRLPESSTVWIPESHELMAGLQGELKDIARGQTWEQLVMNLTDTVRAAIFHESPTLLGPLTDLLVGIGPLPDPFPIGGIIDRVVGMGGKIWGTPEGNKEVSLLFTLCRSFGDRFTVDQIDQLLWRGEGYSRTGINALDMLYTCFPQHVASLALAVRYAERSERKPAYFCALREAHPTVSDFGLGRAAVGFQSYGLCLVKGGELELIDKLANRGVSAILDYLVAVE